VVRGLVVTLVIAVGVWLLAIILLASLGHRSKARELVALIPNLIALFRGLLRDPRVPRSSKIWLWFAIAWLVSPIDLVPEFIPVAGPLDDAIVAALVLRHVLKRTEPGVLAEHWRGDAAILDAIARSHRRNSLPDSPASRALTPGSQVLVRLVKQRRPDVQYQAVVTFDDGTHIVVQGPWAEVAARDLGFVRFEPGDVFTEHYWRDRWYSIKEVRSQTGVLKGWYCDVARPVHVREGRIDSEDLDLDLWVSPDGRTVLRLDEDDFTASALAERDPVAAAEALRAMEELESLAREGFREVLG
jgi:uncharacterized membrane protein YkvA (DUF1232 family)